MGAVAPSSKYLTKKMLGGLELVNADVVIELGPGTGVFTERLLELIGPKTTLLVIEINETFYENLELVRELIKILKANHMASSDKEVMRKAETIMAQADKDGDGVVSFDEFVIVSKKFPNILFPAYSLGKKH